MAVENEPADYVRVEIRRGGATTVYEFEGAPDWPIAVSEQIESRVREVQDGVLLRFAPGPMVAEISLSGMVRHAERVIRS